MPRVRQKVGTVASTPVAPFCLLRIELEVIEPPISRLLIVPTDANLGWLHAVIQVAMGWTNSHLHQFSLGDRTISDPKFNLQVYEEDPPVTDERTVTLADCLAAKGSGFRYEYDFGDSWQHTLTLKRPTKSQVGIEKRAVCLAGERACPPEDCGSVPGYVELVSALRDRKHPEHRRMQEWLGRPYDPEYFQVGKTNELLAKLAWPKVTEAGLSRVLMAGA